MNRSRRSSTEKALDDKRFMTANEMLETEQSYVDVLSLLVSVLLFIPLTVFVQFKANLEAHIALKRSKGDSLEGMPDQAEIAMMFGKIPALLTIHKKVLGKLKTLVSEWGPHSKIGHVSFSLICKENGSGLGDSCVGTRTLLHSICEQVGRGCADPEQLR